eukprot:TRINITY_DN50_c1_g1_i2.p1 TRINITY_DN50_c1_g1~~TRINITY_DN50_c1_g1_i2.p1  ORF type:complete len:581 (-),score=188.98 TRINITY_DN50_c1_g1_i2:641-2383(-)
MGKIIVVTSIGVFCATRPKGNPLFDAELLPRLGRLCNLVFLPAMVCSSMGGALTAAMLVEYLPLLFADSALRLLSWAVAAAVERLLPVEPRLYKAVKFAILFTNVGTIPLLYLDSLCDQAVINAEFDGSASLCFESGTNMIFVYLITWHLWFYSWGFFKLAEANELDHPLPPAVAGKSTLQLEEGASPGIKPEDAILEARQESNATTDSMEPVGNTEDVTQGPASLDDVESTGVRRRLPRWLTGQQSGRDRALSEHSQKVAVIIASHGAKQLGCHPAIPVLPVAVLERDEHHHSSPLLASPRRSSDYVSDHNQNSGSDSIHTPPITPAAHSHNGSHGHVRTPSALARLMPHHLPHVHLPHMSMNVHLHIPDVLPELPKLGAQLKRAASTPPNIAVALGVIIGLIPPLADGLFHNSRSPLRPIGAAMVTVGQPYVAIATLLMASSLAQSRKNTALPTPTVVGTEVMDAAQLHSAQQEQARREKITMLVLVFCPLVVVPMLGFGIFAFLDNYTPILNSATPLMKLLIIFQLGMPSGLSVIISLSQMHLPAMASSLARMYMYQYLLSIITLTVLAALTMAYIY